MSSLRTFDYILLADGSSDAVLLPIIEWLAREHGYVGNGEFQSAASTGGAPLRKRVQLAIEEFGQPDVLFIHRDAEREPQRQRIAEIAEALAELKLPWIPIVPVRMTEAWLLTNETAIRRAAGNPNGREVLSLPQLQKIEKLPNPKEILHDLLVKASSKNPRLRKRAKPRQQVHMVTTFTDSFERLRKLPSFAVFHTAMADALAVLRNMP